MALVTLVNLGKPGLMTVQMTTITPKFNVVCAYIYIYHINELMFTFKVS